MNTSASLCLGAVVLLGVSSVSLAEPDRQGHPPRVFGRARVVLFSEADYRGQSVVLYAGDNIPDFANEPFREGGQSNDRVSSILIEGPVELSAYTDSRYRGDLLRLSESHPNLADLPGPNRGNWNDVISSASATRVERRPRSWNGGPGRGDLRGPRVELYSDANFQGPRLVLTVGDRVTNLADVGFDDDSSANDSISSIRIVGDLHVTLYEDGELRGSKLQLTESVPNLAFRMGRSGSRSWNDCISALVVTKQDPRSAKEIVTRAYRDVLKRDPDPKGLEDYTRLVVEEGWTDAQVRDSLRSSDEYRNRRR